MVQTMHHHPRCVGLAAPQVGWHAQVAVIDASRHPKGPREARLMILVNPRMTAQGGRTVQREGCLSVPDLTGNVPRAKQVRIRAVDGDGQPVRNTVEGFEAIVVQHELDHLAGILFLDRVANVRTDVFRRKRYWLPESGTR